MSVQPEPVTPALVDEASTAAHAKRLPALDRLRSETYDEGQRAQVLYVGPYDDEGPVLEQLHADVHARCLRRPERHHEIHLSGPHRVEPTRLRRILRQPASG